MSNKKFEVVTSIPLGKLTPEMRVKWDRLYELQTRILALQEEFDEKADEFKTVLSEEFGTITDAHGLLPNYRVDEENNVAMQYCECPPCQAELHHMSVADTVEAMFRSSLIPPDEIDEARAFAKEFDLENAKDSKLVN